MVGVFCVAILPVLSAPVLPTIDFYDHLDRYFVLSHVSKDGFLSENYRSKWSLLPNIGLDVLGTALMSWVKPVVGAKIISIFIFLVQYSGILVFNRAVTGRFSVLVAV